jgi:hypothetical protein
MALAKMQKTAQRQKRPKPNVYSDATGLDREAKSQKQTIFFGL